MKVIHTGDIHIGSALKTLPPDKARTRKAELLDGFRRLCAYAKEIGAGAVLIAGDLFDENGAAETLKREVLSAIAAAGVAFFYVSGNHDDELAFGDGIPENLRLFSAGHGWNSYALGGVTVTGMDTKNFSEEKFRSLALPKDTFNIVLAHGDISDPRSGEYIPLAALRNKNIDYLALGHIHRPTLAKERLDERCEYRYCGCLEGRGFDEEGARGFFLLDVANGRVREEKFLSFAKRAVQTRRADISACAGYFDVETAALAALKDVRAEDMVKLVLCGNYKTGLRKDIPLLTARLGERFFFVKVEDESKLYFDPREYERDLTERGEFVREVGRYEMNEELRAEILEVGLKALNGEEIDL